VWLSTTGPDGAPHTAPVWVAVADGSAHLFTSRGTRKARNVAANPRVVVHLPDAEDVLIVEGRLRDVGRPEDAAEVVAAFAAKYADPDDRAYLPGVDTSVDVLYALDPNRALTWRLADFEGSQQRWGAPAATG
jgi:PPOX class probable F420-dependent enzyme